MTETVSKACEIYNKAKADRLTTIATRLELQTNPYTSFTKQQLDMRRKAEILKYNPTRSNSQTNASNQKEKFSQIMRGSYKQCQVDTPSKLVSTTASDVPGPPMYLYEDPNVKLYNYRNDFTFAFGISQIPKKTTTPST